MEKEIAVYKAKVFKFEQLVRKAICADPEYARLTAQIRETKDKFNALYEKRFKMQCELEKKISAKLMKDPEIAKLVDVYEE